MAQQKRVTVPITINISEESFKVLSGEFKNTPVAEALGSRCGQFVEAWSGGGVLLSPSDVTAVQTNYGKPVSGPRDVVKATEQAGDRNDGRSVFSFTIDPAYEGPLMERANEVGRTPGELMSDAIQYALEQEWIYSLQCDGVRHIFNQQQQEFFAEFTGRRDFSVRDIETACRARGKRKETPQLEEVVA